MEQSLNICSKEHELEQPRSSDVHNLSVFQDSILGLPFFRAPYISPFGGFRLLGQFKRTLLFGGVMIQGEVWGALFLLDAQPNGLLP